MTSPDREPGPTPGPRPGETPPAEGGISGISHPEPAAPRKAWGTVWLAVITAVVVLVGIGLIAMAVTL